MVGDVPHERVGQGVGQSRQRSEHPNPRRVHPQPEVEHDEHAADGCSEGVVDEAAHPVDHHPSEADPVLGAGLVGITHGAGSCTAGCCIAILGVRSTV